MLDVGLPQPTFPEPDFKLPIIHRHCFVISCFVACFVIVFSDIMQHLFFFGDVGKSSVSQICCYS